jgi:hypothetical protein
MGTRDSGWVFWNKRKTVLPRLKNVTAVSTESAAFQLQTSHKRATVCDSRSSPHFVSFLSALFNDAGSCQDYVSSVDERYWQVKTDVLG